MSYPTCAEGLGKYDNVGLVFTSIAVHHEAVCSHLTGHLEARESKPLFVLWVHHLILTEIFLICDKKTLKKYIWLDGMLEVVDRLSSVVFVLVLGGLWWKLAFSHNVWEIPNVFMHYQLDKKLWHSHVAGYGPDWLAGIIVNHNPDFMYKFECFLLLFFIIRTIILRLSSSRIFAITIRFIQLFSNP